MRPEDVQASFCAVLAEEWSRAAVTDAVVAPGSRSTPLVDVLDRYLRVHLVLDERSAGFTALGLGLASGRPAVVVTTSGTAAVELHPAVVEAFQAGVPLLAVTADRPAELHRVGAPQTVEQGNIFGGAVLSSFDPGVPDLAAAGSWRSLASRCVAEAVSGAGPVHLNLPFREPLLGHPGDLPESRDGPWHTLTPATSQPDPEICGLLQGERGIIVAGAGAGEPAAVLELAHRLGWPVFADPRSGCRLADPAVVAAADALLRLPEVAAWQPDTVLRLGAPWASKALAQWLAGLPPKVTQILSDPAGRWGDPDRVASHVTRAGPQALLREIPPGDNTISGWCERWQAAESRAQHAMDDLLDEGRPLDLSEPAIARACLRAVPEGGRLVASSSMPVRDVEWYGAPRAGATVFANRGANGIDGVLSTSIGVALYGGDPTLVLLGDLAFLYDVGALLWANDRPISLSVVVVDNNGGGIFSFLPQATTVEREKFERYWGTPHRLDLARLAAAYGIPGESVNGREQLEKFLCRIGEPGVRVAVVPSDRSANVDAHDRINSAVARELRTDQGGQ